MEPTAFQRRIIQAKYKGKHIGDIPINRKFSYSKAPWRFIGKNLLWFKDNQNWKINNGDQISFWHSNLSQEGSLSINYPTLFTLTLDKDISVKEPWDTTDRSWVINFRRPMNKREI